MVRVLREWLSAVVPSSPVSTQLTRGGPAFPAGAGPADSRRPRSGPPGTCAHGSRQPGRAPSGTCPQGTAPPGTCPHGRGGARSGNADRTSAGLQPEAGRKRESLVALGLVESVSRPEGFRCLSQVSEVDLSGVVVAEAQ